jgi:hypothetical protein
MVLRIPVPAPEKRGGDHNEGDGEADPEAVNTPVQQKTRADAERQAEEPVGDQVGPHGRTGFSQAAERASGDRLDGVEDLEGGGETEEAGTDSHHGGIAGVERNKRARRHEEDDGGQKHEANAESESEPAGAARPVRISRADGVADGNGRGGRQAERDHIGQGGVIESDLMRGKLDGREPASGKRGQIPGTDLQHNLSGGGSAKPDKLADLEQTDTRPVAEERVTTCALVTPGESEKNNGHRKAGYAGGDGRAVHAEARKAELAIDEDPVAKPVEEIGNDKGDENDVDLAYALKVSACSGVQKQRQRPECKDAEIAAGRRRDLLRDADVGKAEAGGNAQQHKRRGDDEGEVNALGEPVMAGIMVAAAIGLRDKRVETEEQANAEEAGSVVDSVAERDRADGGGAETTDHNDVHDRLQHPADFAEDNGNGKHDHRAQFPSPIGLDGGIKHNSNGSEGAVEPMDDTVAEFLISATVPTDGSDHCSGTLETAEAILAREPRLAGANIYTAAVLGDEAAVRSFLAADTKSATETGGPHDWDALTYLCFSNYLRLDAARSESFVWSARALLEAGADANTGWWSTYVYNGVPRPESERVMYGASAVARNAALTRLLLEFGADVNDGETAYHASEGYDNTVLEILLASGRFNQTALTTVLARKADWHDDEGLKLALKYGADPNSMEHWGLSGTHHAVKRDNWLPAIELLLDHGGDVTVKNKYGFTAAELAARRGRGDVLRLLAERGIDPKLEGVNSLIAACAQADDAAIRAQLAQKPELQTELVAAGGTLLAQFAGNGNAEGMKRLMELGVQRGELYEGDGYFEIAKDSTALHVAAWRGRPEAVKLLIEHGVPVNALDGWGRTALQLAVCACVDSYWKKRRTPEWVEPLLQAGATTAGITIPCGYPEADALLSKYASAQS